MLTIIKVSVIVLLIGLLVRTAYALIDIYLDERKTLALAMGI